MAGLAAKKPDCALCALLFAWCARRLEDTTPNFLKELQGGDTSIVFSRAGSYLATGKKHEERVASLNWAQNVRYSQGVQPGFPKLPLPGSAMYNKVLSLWVGACDKNHSCFPGPTTFLPTRLIEVGSQPSGDPGKIDKVRLLYRTDEVSRSSKYLALSHRWGPPRPPTPSTFGVGGDRDRRREMVRTTRKKDTTGPRGTKLHERVICLTDLPATFRDAILVTRSLGVGYLWIDSLCIVQDDLEDWNRESQLMERVFSDAYCTIAATRASGTDHGFLAPQERNVVVMREATSDDLPEFYVCEMIDDFDEHVSRSDLQRRGWVLQERALSRRTIHFADRQVYWECGKGVRCETLMKTNNDKAAFLGDPDFPSYADTHSKGKRIKLIQDLYEQYSAMGLTYARDRPAAIRGLEARLVRTIGGPGGYGIFRQHMHRYLLWMRSPSAAGQGLPRVTDFPATSSAPPSWSWMAYSGEIKYVDVPGQGVEWDASLVWPQSKMDPIPTRLEAPVLDIVELDGSEIPGEDTWSVMDDSQAPISRPAKCVVVGTLKTPTPYCWVLIVAPVDNSGLAGSSSASGMSSACARLKARMKRKEKGKLATCWQRLGVAKVNKTQIMLETGWKDRGVSWIV